MAKTRFLGVLLSALAATVAIGVSVAGAQQRAVGVTPPRLSFVDGEVSYWRPGAEDWVPAQINTALAAGDSLYAAGNGNIELEIASRAYVRAGSGTELGVESLETGYLQLRVPSGHAAVDLRRMPEGQEIEVDTPNGAFLINRAGYYRFDVDDDATRFSTRRGGVARIVPAGIADEMEVTTNQTVMVAGTETATLERVATVGDDAWDRWNYDRLESLGEQPRSAQFVAGEVAGVDDLDRYGDWQDTRDYGNVWVPRGVASDWAPYTDGRWVWDGYYGWTWVDDSPWGWAPYHYGRWCRVGSYWGWAPGPIVARPAYSPALVAFFGGGNVGVSVSVGTPFVSWVALGWGEPVVPWWGPRGFVGRPYWGGWGGPRYVNNVRIQNTTIINVTNIHNYDNFRHRAVVGIDGDRFGRGRDRIQHVRVDGDRLRNLRPVRGELAVRPVRDSLVARTGRGERPPDHIQNRRVVATRAPQDPSRAPRAAGLVPSDSRRQPAPRIVAPRSERGGSRDVRGAGRDVPPTRGASGERQRVESVRGRDDRGETRGNVDGGRIRDRGAEQGTANRDGSGRDAGRAERVPGGSDERGRGNAERENAMRTAPRSPDENRRIRGDGGGDRNVAPTRPENGRGEELRLPERQERGERGRDARPEPPSRMQSERPARTDRQPAPPREDARERSRPQSDQPQRMERMEAPRRNERESRQEQPRQEQPRMERREQPRVERQQPQRMERQAAPRMERQEQPRMERQQPRMERQQQPRMERQAEPRVERQQQPREQRQEQPRMQRQEQPRQERGGGGDGGGGGGRNREERRGRD